MNAKESILGPESEIAGRLNDFVVRVPVWSVTAFTVDGYVIAHRVSQDRVPESIEPVISSMSAGLITIAEDFIRLVDQAKVFGQTLVDSQDAEGGVSFSIILRHAAQNLLVTCIFPHTTPLGLATFEFEALCKEIAEVSDNWNVRLHDQTLT